MILGRAIDDDRQAVLVEDLDEAVELHVAVERRVMRDDEHAGGGVGSDCCLNLSRSGLVDGPYFDGRRASQPDHLLDRRAEVDGVTFLDDDFVGHAGGIR